MDDVIVRPDSVQSAEDCVVLLEELIQSNRNLVAENQKLREEHDQANKKQAEVLQRIEERLNQRHADQRIPRGRSNPSRRRSNKARNTSVPTACRVSIKF